MIEPFDTVPYGLSPAQLKECIANALPLTDSITDRSDLHNRSYLERFTDVLLGEISERMVIEWLHSQGKYAESAVDKHAEHPDLGHDIWIKHKNGKIIKRSVKSSLSALKTNMKDILSTFSPAFKANEIRDVNIQVYFWLNLYQNPRVSVPSENNAAVIGWMTGKALKSCSQQAYATEQRKKADTRLTDMRAMNDLLQWLS